MISQVLIGDELFSHWGGHPSTIEGDLAYWLANYPDESLNFVAWSLKKGIPGVLATAKDGLDHYYEPADFPLKWNLDRLFIIATKDGKNRLYSVDMADVIGKDKRTEWWQFNGEYHPKTLDHPILEYKPSTYRKMFCKPEFEVQIPDPRVPVADRLYYHRGVVDRATAERLGLPPINDVGAYGSYVGANMIRVRSRKGASPKRATAKRTTAKKTPYKAASTRRRTR